MSILVPTCQRVQIIAFRGDRSLRFAGDFQKKLDAERHGTGPGPTSDECLLYAGHAGISVDGGSTIYGFNPDGSGAPAWFLFNSLKNGDRFHGVVRDDTAAFQAANRHGLLFVSFAIILPDPYFQDFAIELDRERWKSKYYYGFPNGRGDCNCITWLERMGLPLVSGRMNEFVAIPGMSHHSQRRFGLCK